MPAHHRAGETGQIFIPDDGRLRDVVGNGGEPLPSTTATSTGRSPARDRMTAAACSLSLRMCLMLTQSVWMPRRRFKFYQHRVKNHRVKNFRYRAPRELLMPRAFRSTAS